MAKTCRPFLFSLQQNLFAAGLLVVSVNAAAETLNGKVLFETRCATCHQLPDVMPAPADGWTKKIDSMAPLAQLSVKEKGAILVYLMTVEN